MKQRPVFILLTFFLALTAVVMITFVFLRTQLNEHKLQNLVEDTIHKNFQDFQVTMDQIGLNLGTKFRYKIAKIKIEYKNKNGVFSSIHLKNVSIKFPLFFLLGKQDIDVSIEEMDIDTFNFNMWIKNKYKITTLITQSLNIPKFLVDNRINLTVEKLKFTNDIGQWPNPISLSSIDHLVLKDFSITGKTAIEFNATAVSRDTINNDVDSAKFNFVAIGHIGLGQFVSTGLAESKLLLEVKSVTKPEFSWLMNHRLQLTHDSQNSKTTLNIHGSAVEGKSEIVILPGAVSFREIDLTLKVEELIKESSVLKNVVYLIGDSLNAIDIKDGSIRIQGNLSYVQFYEDSPDQTQASWIAHISSLLSSKTSKLAFDLDTQNSGYFYRISVGNDLSYRKILVSCEKISCYAESLRSVEINFYNQILLKDEKLSVNDLVNKISTWWGTILPLLSNSKTTPFKVFWKKNRWNDFEFDLFSDIAINKTILASENIVVKNFSKDVIDAKLSLVSGESNQITTRLITVLKEFPSSLLVKLFPQSQLEFTGPASGIIGGEFNTQESKITADLRIVDGNISWLNFDDIYRRSIFLNPEDEIKYPNLNWTSQFKNSSLALQWTEKDKAFNWELLLPKTNKKVVRLKFDEVNKMVKTEIQFFTPSVSDKKYLQQSHGSTSVAFDFSYSTNELKIVPKSPSSNIESVNE